MSLQLPWELEEEILSRLPLQALLRCRTVSKHWNSLLNDKSFLKNLLSRSLPQFILKTTSKVYLIDIIGFNPNSIDPMIELCLLPSPGIGYDDRNLKRATIITTCDEFLFCHNNRSWKNESALWNPLLRQVTRIDHKDNQFKVVGLGYDNSRPDKVYKMLVWYWGYRDGLRYPDHQRVAIYECASHEFKSIDTPDDDWPISTPDDDDGLRISIETGRRSYVPLNGNLYWVEYNRKTCEYFIQSFDFSWENFKPLCLLPCKRNHRWDQDSLLLAVFEGDRFSLLKVSYETRNIGIWVTKKRISYNNAADGEGLVWIRLMTLAIKLPLVIVHNMFYGPTSYFIYNKTIFMCCGRGQNGVACIYVVKEHLCKKIPINSGIVNFCHCVYAPNLISIPFFI